ncbi:hypothetical protein Bca4012_014537 [Brassica carinata]
MNEEDISPFFYFGIKAVTTKLNLHFVRWIRCRKVNGDVIVVAEVEHTCMISRGIEKFGSSTATVAVLGRFSSDISARSKFLESIQKTD